VVLLSEQSGNRRSVESAPLATWVQKNLCRIVELLLMGLSPLRTPMPLRSSRSRKPSKRKAHRKHPSVVIRVESRDGNLEAACHRETQSTV
jgi:hypothetical protein